MKSECCTCSCFDAYFTKAYCCYLRTDCGYCDDKKQVTNKHTPACEKYRKKFTTKPYRYGMILNEIADVITKINVIKDFIDETGEL